MSGTQRPQGGLLARLKAAYHRVEQFNDDFFVSKWRAALQREARRQEEVLLALLFLEAMGVENPAGYQTLDLYPHLVESFHQWHQRQGLEHYPMPGVCC